MVPTVVKDGAEHDTFVGVKRLTRRGRHFQTRPPWRRPVAAVWAASVVIVVIATGTARLGADDHPGLLAAPATVAPRSVR